MSSAAEARFRIQGPNSSARAIKVVALDQSGSAAVARLADGSWPHAKFLTVAVDGSLRDRAGAPTTIGDEVDTADLVVMVAGPGGQAHAAAALGEACSGKRVMTTALVVGAASASDAELSQTLAQVRPWSLMVVIADADEYISDMLIALQAG